MSAVMFGFITLKPLTQNNLQFHQQVGELISFLLIIIFPHMRKHSIFSCGLSHNTLDVL
jgi:hypothetical protein